MAIALEADFRSIKTSQTPEPADRQPADRGRGEEFASSLERARSADAEKESIEAEDAAAAAPASAPLPFLPADTELASTAGAADPSAPPTPPTSQETADTLLKSEIVIDRELVREDVKSAAAEPVAADTTDIAAKLAGAAPQPDAPPGPVGPPGIPAEVSPAPSLSAASPQAVSPEPARSDHVKRAPTASTPEVSATAGATMATVTSAAIEIVQAAPPADAVAPQVQENTSAPAPANPDAGTPAQSSTQAAAVPDVPLPDAVTSSLTGAADKVALADAANQSSPAGSSPSLAAATAAPAPTPAAPAAAPAVLAAPAHAVLTASPAQIVDIVAQSAEDGQSDRVVVQLDPPELGRVSIDFKFDAQGLQHVTITSETPEAMRQLRQMHFELVQSLERHGIGSQNMTFQHQQQDTPQSRTPNPFARAGALGDAGIDASAALASTQQIPGARTLPGDRLDIRL